MDRHHDGTSSSDSDASQSNLPKQMAACKTCKDKHRRCDGLAPCGSCIKHGVECEPSQKPSRKGPTRGELKDLRESVGQLQQELEVERQKYKDLQEKFQLMRNKKEESDDISLSGHLSSTHALDVTLRRYNEHVLPWYQVSVPYKDFQFIRYKKGKSNNACPDLDPRTLCTYACLLAGSTMGGDSRLSLELFQLVRTGLTNMYDMTDPYICAAYMMLARIYVMFIDNDKAALCNTVALQMSERLIEKLKVQEVNGINLEVVRQNCLLNCMDNNKERQIQSLKQVVAKTTLSPKGITIQAVYLLRQTWALISKAMRTNDKLFNSPENIRYIFSLISIVKAMADKSDIRFVDCFPLKFDSNRPFRDILKVRLISKVAILTYLIGMDHTADIFVNRVLENAENLCKELHHTMFLVVIPLFMLGQVLVFKGDHVNIERIIRIIKRLTSVSPHASIIIDSLSRAELDCNIPEYYEAIFHQYIHRFRSTNLTYGNALHQISEGELLSLFEDAPEVTVTKKARIDDRRSVPTAAESTQTMPQSHQPHMRVHQPIPHMQAVNHVVHMQHAQYSYPATNGHHNPSMYYTQTPPYAPQQHYTHNYATQQMMTNNSHAQSTLNLSLDYEEIVETSPPTYPPPRSDTNGFNSYPYYPHSR